VNSAAGRKKGTLKRGSDHVLLGSHRGFGWQLAKLLRQAEISNLDDLSTLLGEHQVLNLQITMGDSTLVEVFNSSWCGGNEF